MESNLCRLGSYNWVGAILGQPGDPPPDSLLQPCPLACLCRIIHLLQSLLARLQHLHVHHIKGEEDCSWTGRQVKKTDKMDRTSGEEEKTD